ncbi:hypothetical protein [Psychromonas ingrahamii]|uniref:hypothetical protein n=1 Tax=Psychromonas ingrahamii TaxID=357794 RepID=UPI0003136EC6|nr:hypothetical protein [Psychromonas ingrahamii]
MNVGIYDNDLKGVRQEAWSYLRQFSGMSGLSSACPLIPLSSALHRDVLSKPVRLKGVGQRKIKKWLGELNDSLGS